MISIGWVPVRGGGRELLSFFVVYFQKFTCKCKGPYPLGDFGVIGRYNWPPTADYSADPSSNHPVGMAY